MNKQNYLLVETPPMAEKRQLTDPAGEEFCLLPTSGVAAQRTVSTYPRDDRGAQQLWAPDAERPDQERARASYGSVGAVPQNLEPYGSALTNLTYTNCGNDVSNWTSSMTATTCRT